MTELKEPIKEGKMTQKKRSESYSPGDALESSINEPIISKTAPNIPTNDLEAWNAIADEDSVFDAVSNKDDMIETQTSQDKPETTPEQSKIVSITKAQDIPAKDSDFFASLKDLNKTIMPTITNEAKAVLGDGNLEKHIALSKAYAILRPRMIAVLPNTPQKNGKALYFANYSDAKGWEQLTIDAIEKELVYMANDNFGKSPKKTISEAMYHFEKTRIHTTTESMWNDFKNSIPLADGGFSIQVEDFSIIKTPPNDFMFERLPVSSAELIHADETFDGSNWNRILKEIFPDEEGAKIEWLQMAYGSCFLGNPKSIFPILTGSGGNGKGVFVKALELALGDFYTREADDSLYYLLKGQGQPHPHVKEHLRTCILSIASEIPAEGCSWNAAGIKALTSSDSMVSNKKFENATRVKAKCVPVIQGNHLPRLPEWGDAIKRRFKLIKFTTSQFDKKDTLDENQMEQLLIKDRAYILCWLINGAKKYLKTKSLPVCKQIERDSEEYINEQNRFLNDLKRYYMFTNDPKDFVSYNDIIDHLQTMQPIQYKDLNGSIVGREVGKTNKLTRLRVSKSDGTGLKGIRLI